jgi:predicted DNA-binding protein
VSPSKGTPITSVRIPTPLRRRLEAKAARTGTTLTAVIVAALEEYVEGEDT